MIDAVSFIRELMTSMSPSVDQALELEDKDGKDAKKESPPVDVDPIVEPDVEEKLIKNDAKNDERVF